MSPNLTATVRPDTRARLVYKVSTGALTSSMAGQVPEKINDAWRASGQAVVISPATQPVAGGANLLGRREWFTTIDIKTSYNLPTVTWDSYLSPLRRVPLGWLGFDVRADLDSADVLSQGATSATTAPAARSATTQRAAAASEVARTSLPELVTSATKRLLLFGALVLVVVAVWKGPELARELRKVVPSGARA